MRDTRDFFNARAPSYERLSAWSEQQDLLDISLNMIKGIHGTVVDLGAGTGSLLCKLKGFSRRIAVDNSQAMLDRIEDPTVEKLLADITDIPLTSSSVSLAICRQVLHYTNPTDVLLEVRRILMPRGHLHIAQITAYDSVPREWYLYWVALRNISCRRIFYRNELMESLSQAGFSVLSTTDHEIDVSYLWSLFFEKNNVPPERAEEIKLFFVNASDEVRRALNLSTTTTHISYRRRFTFLMAQNIKRNVQHAKARTQ